MEQMSQVKFLKDVIINGNLTVTGINTTESAEQILTKGALTVINADNNALAATSMGTVIRTGNKDDNEKYIDYAIIYDPLNEAVKLGCGEYNSETNAFTFGENEGKPIATRDLTNDDDGYLVMWDAQNHCLVKSSIKDSGGVLDTNIKLSEDLYTYAPIGMAQQASSGIIGNGSAISVSNPGKIGTANESLKAVFNRIFGEEQKIEPTINRSHVKLEISSNAGTYGGGEYGTSVAETTITYTIKLSNEATAQYGYRCGDTQINTSNAKFYYPATSDYAGGTAQLQIILPSGSSRKDITAIAGEIVGDVDNYIYWNFSDSKEVKFSVTLNSTTVSTAQQTRYGQVKAKVTLGTPQTNDTTGATATSDNSTIITKFLAYKPTSKIYEDSTKSISHSLEPVTRDPIYISAGSYYPYYLVSASDQLTTETSGAIRFSSTTTSSAITPNITAEGYLWFLLPPTASSDADKFVQYQALGSWYAFDTDAEGNPAAAVGPSTTKLTLQNGNNTTVEGYKGYRTKGKVSAGTTSFKIV